MPLLVSCLSEGLLLVDGDRVERLDRVPSAGLAAGPAVRAVHEPSETAQGGRVDFTRERSLDVHGLRDVHEIAWDAELLACVATLENAVLWVDRNGQAVRRWAAPGDGDCWHLSGICVAGNRVLVTAFGRFARHRDWAEMERRGAGLVLEVPSGEVVARGLDAPHSPRVAGGELVVCDSGRCELVAGDRRAHLGGWTRGVAVGPEELVVGVSAPRGTPGSASLVFLRRGDLAVRRRIRLPVREVFDVAYAAEPEARELARTSYEPPRTVPLRSADLRVAVSAPARLRLSPGSVTDLSCTVTNLGSKPLEGAPPFPVSLVAGWIPESRALWSPLPRPVGPGESARVTARVLAPASPGRHALELRLVQEGVAWLDGSATTEVTVA